MVPIFNIYVAKGVSENASRYHPKPTISTDQKMIDCVILRAPWGSILPEKSIWFILRVVAKSCTNRMVETLKNNRIFFVETC